MTAPESNFQLFLDCFSSALLQRVATVAPKTNASRRRCRRKSSTNAASEEHRVTADADASTKTDELAEFTEYLASEVFESLPDDLRSISFSVVQDDPRLRHRYDPEEAALTTSALSERLLAAVPLSVAESLEAYELLAEGTSFPPLFAAAVSEYITSATAPPPVWSSTRATECEICGRDWIPLSYHHLIPKSTHEKVLKRNWHDAWVLNSVAWLCRACHTFVHRCESNETLAREYYTVERLMEREDVQKWAVWVGRVRWRAR